MSFRCRIQFAAVAIACAISSTSVSASAAESREAQIRAIRETIVEGINTPLPFYGEAPRGSVFRTNLDWHSSVHAHWALLSIARVTADAELDRWVRARLTDSALRRERIFLSNRKHFENPYGRAWMLLLLRELSLRDGGLSEEGLRLRAVTEASLLTYLETQPLPEDSDSFISHHDSWLFAFWLFQKSGPEGLLVRELDRLKQLKLDPVRARIPKSGYTDYDFLYLPAVVALIDRDPGYPRDDPPELPAEIRQENAHVAGAHLVRLWPYAEACAQGNASSCQEFSPRFERIFSRTDLWRDDFEAVSHWVPQFAWMAIWLESGSP